MFELKYVLTLHSVIRVKRAVNSHLVSIILEWSQFCPQNNVSYSSSVIGQFFTLKEPVGDSENLKIIMFIYNSWKSNLVTLK